MPSGHSSSSHVSHSSSSHSSSFHSSSRSSFSSSSSRPSSHSSTSYSSSSSVRKNPNRNYGRQYADNRKERQMPIGYTHYNDRPPRRIRTVNHVYMYYPMGWSYGGRYYNSGYYDEYGTYYSSITCECPNCGTRVTYSLDREYDSFVCPNCGEVMDVVSYQEEPVRKKSGGTFRTFWIILFSVLAIGLALVSVKNLIHLFHRNDTPVDTIPTVDVVDNNGDESLYGVDNTVIFGEKLYLSRNSSGSYTITNSSSYDAVAEWSKEYEAYYDRETGMWYWYNTYVEPPVWQYWYEGISGDYGDYGWMEYEDGIWWIEKDYGDWIQVPNSYNVNELWHIEE